MPKPLGLSDAAWAGLPVLERAVQIARQECDVRRVREEGGNNRGPRVEEYLRSAGAEPGQPWCAAFATWCLRQAGWTAFPPIPAFSLSWMEWAKRTGRWSEAPRRGELFVCVHGPHSGHVGFVLGEGGLGTIRTIEGNSNDDGSANGFEVVRRNRRKATVAGYVRLEGAAAVSRGLQDKG